MAGVAGLTASVRAEPPRAIACGRGAGGGRWPRPAARAALEALTPFTASQCFMLNIKYKAVIRSFGFAFTMFLHIEEPAARHPRRAVWIGEGKIYSEHRGVELVHRHIKRIRTYKDMEHALQ